MLAVVVRYGDRTASDWESRSRATLLTWGRRQCPVHDRTHWSPGTLLATQYSTALQGHETGRGGKDRWAGPWRPVWPETRKPVTRSCLHCRRREVEAHYSVHCYHGKQDVLRKSSPKQLGLSRKHQFLSADALPERRDNALLDGFQVEPGRGRSDFIQPRASEFAFEMSRSSATSISHINIFKYQKINSMP